MNPPEILNLLNEEAYKNYYVENYCNKCPIFTFDGIPVMFYPEKFEHAFYKRSKATWKAKKSLFDVSRAERMDWIKAVLQDPQIIPKKGFDKARDSYDNKRRVTFLNEENYLVVIELDKKGKGIFVTAYLVDNENAAEKIRSSPNWEK